MVLHVSDRIMTHLPGDTLPDAVVAAVAWQARDVGHARLAIEFADGSLAADVADTLAQAGFEEGAVAGSGVAHRRGGIAAGRLIEIKAPGHSAT